MFNAAGGVGIAADVSNPGHRSGVPPSRGQDTWYYNASWLIRITVGPCTRHQDVGDDVLQSPAQRPLAASQSVLARLITMFIRNRSCMDLASCLRISARKPPYGRAKPQTFLRPCEAASGRSAETGSYSLTNQPVHQFTSQPSSTTTATARGSRGTAGGWPRRR